MQLDSNVDATTTIFKVPYHHLQSTITPSSKYNVPDAPPSTIAGIKPCKSSQTCKAVVGEGFPDLFAEGAAIGRPHARKMAKATG